DRGRSRWMPPGEPAPAPSRSGRRPSAALDAPGRVRPPAPDRTLVLQLSGDRIPDRPCGPHRPGRPGAGGRRGGLSRPHHSAGPVRHPPWRRADAAHRTGGARGLYDPVRLPRADEAETFRIVQSVSGIGPRTALAVLAVLDPEELRRAVAEQDAKTITRTPGIGPKVASRMLLELGGKLPAPSGSLPVSGTEAAAPAAPAAPGVDTDVVAALVGLGWAEKASLAAVEKVRADREAEDAEELDAAQLLRHALRRLGGNR